MTAQLITILSLSLALSSGLALAKDKDKNSSAYKRGYEDGGRKDNDNPYHTPGGEKYERWEKGHKDGREDRKNDNYRPSYPSYPSYSPSYPSTYEPVAHNPWPASDSRYDGNYPTTSSSSGSSSSGGGSPVSCSPKDVKTNVAQADKAMAELATSEFNGNETFKEVADDIAGLKNVDFKISEYLRLSGVKNPKDANEVLNFLYGRQVDAQNAQRVSELLAISKSDAERVIEKIKTSLRMR
jgi:hypothetical protein